MPASIDPISTRTSPPSLCCCCRAIRMPPPPDCARGSPRTFARGRASSSPTAGVALGVAGLPALMDMRGRPDLFGHALRVTQIGFADEIASAASLIMGQADEARPMVLVRGLNWSGPPSPAAALIRLAEEDLFR